MIGITINKTTKIIHGIIENVVSHNDTDIIGFDSALKGVNREILDFVFVSVMPTKVVDGVTLSIELGDVLPTVDITDTINSKITAFDKLCNQTILGGFTSSAVGLPHQYDFDEEAQRNLSGRLTILNANSNYPASFKWKTKDVGPKDHTKAQFVQLCTDADAFKDNTIAKYWVKKIQMEKCTTLVQLDTISWPKNLNPPSIPTGLANVVAATPATPIESATPATPVATPISGQVDLIWTTNADVTMIAGGGYNVYQDGVKVNTTLLTGARFIAVGLTSGNSYKFEITAVDTDGNESLKSASLTVIAA